MQRDAFPFHDGDVFVGVWNVAGYVARVRAVPGMAGMLGTFTTEYAVNAEELRDAAEEAVYFSGGALNASGWYPCPPELAARAIWPAPEPAPEPATEEGPEGESCPKCAGRGYEVIGPLHLDCDVCGGAGLVYDGPETEDISAARGDPPPSPLTLEAYANLQHIIRMRGY